MPDFIRSIKKYISFLFIVIFPIAIFPLFSQTVILNQPYCKIDDSTWEVPSGYYYGQKLYFDISNNGMPDFGNVVWNLFYATAETEEELDTASWQGWAMVNHTPLPLASERLMFEFSVQPSDKIYGKFKAVVYTISKMEITESNVIKERCHQPIYFTDFKVIPAARVAQGQMVTLSWIYDQNEGTEDRGADIYYALSSMKKSPELLTEWKKLDSDLQPSLQIYKKVLVDCANSSEFYEKYITFKIKKSPGKEAFSKEPILITGERISPPIIKQCNVSLVSPVDIRMDYTIIDPDNDSKDPIVTVTCEQNDNCSATVMETKPNYAIIRCCSGRKVTMTLTVEDRQCQSATVVREISTGARTNAENGYEWVTGQWRDDLILKRFPDLKVFIDVRERPYNENGELSDEEIRQGVKLGLYTWASILPGLNLRFVDAADRADLIVYFKKMTIKNASGISSFWNGTGVGSIGIDIDNIAFRKLDFVNHKMKFERAQALFDRKKPVWSYYNDRDSNPATSYAKYCMPFDDVKRVIAKEGKDTDLVCIDWECVDWDNIPYSSLTGKGREGDHDLAWIVQHEFGHTLGLLHVDMDDKLHRHSCAPITSIQYRTGDRSPVQPKTETTWIPRAEFRNNKLPGITAKSSPSIMIGNSWGVGGTDIRAGIFDLDADALNAVAIDDCTCSDFTGEASPGRQFTGYHVVYPKIRQGWLIILQHRTTKKKMYTNDWHVVHEKLGWINNENTYPLDTDWFLVDILDRDEVAKRNTAISLHTWNHSGD